MRAWDRTYNVTRFSPALRGETPAQTQAWVRLHLERWRERRHQSPLRQGHHLAWRRAPLDEGLQHEPPDPPKMSITALATLMFDVLSSLNRRLPCRVTRCPFHPLGSA